ncbi:MAG: SpoIID/LytB domain-containing protein [Parachlamydiaceae bacterium]|nr:SpoIID/LytB domain-containing protein [Parachlamydiaceae bacterium]
MFYQLFVCLAALMSIVAPVDAGIMDVLSRAFSTEAPPKPPSIRILLAHDEPSVFLEVKGKYKIFDPHTNSHINTGFLGKRRTVEATLDGIRWGEEFPGVYQIVIIPDAPDTTTLVDGVEYRGKVYIYDVGGSISLVNQITLEEYLSSVLPQGYPEALPPNLLEAIAITARTDSYSLAQSGNNPYWDVDASKVGYHGHALSRTSKPLENAILVTQNLILHRDGKADWVVNPFAVSWKPASGAKTDKGVVYSAFTIEEAVKLANKGATAVQILEQAFPDTSIQKLEYAAS